MNKDVHTIVFRAFASVMPLFVLQGKWEVPLPKVKAQSQADVFRVITTGKRKSNLFL